MLGCLFIYSAIQWHRILLFFYGGFMRELNLSEIANVNGAGAVQGAVTWAVWGGAFIALWGGGALTGYVGNALFSGIESTAVRCILAGAVIGAGTSLAIDAAYTIDHAVEKH